MLRRLSVATALLVAGPVLAQSAPRSRTIAIDDHLAEDAGIRVGDTLYVSASVDGPRDTVVVSGITKRSADPSEIARSDYHIRMHLDQVQSLSGYGDRVDRFAVATRGDAAAERVEREINASAFGFHAYRSKAIAVETSRTFQVVSRFHRAIGIITIVASAIFLLCIMLLKVDERRRDVAALRLMGVSSLSVVRSIVIEAALVAVLGSAAGVAIGAIVSHFINVYYQGVYRTALEFAVVTPDTVVFSVALSLILGVVAGIVASVRLVRVPPLELFGR